MLDLKNCPFCGGEATHRRFTGNGFTLARVEYTQVSCQKCRIETEPDQPLGNEDRAATAWNRRTLQAVGPEPAVAEQIADAVLDWMVKYDLLDAGNEYGPAEVLAVLNDLAPSERSALVATPPAERVVEAAGYAERLAIALWEKHYRNAAPNWKPLTGDLIGILTQIDNMTSGLALATKPAVKDDETVVALPNWNCWRSIDTAPEDCRVILATAGNWVGEAIMLRDEDTGEQVWTWVDTGKPSLHSCYGWMHLPEHLSAPVLSDLRPDGFDGPTGAE